MNWKLVVIISAAALTACVSNDPRQGGFFGGLNGINSGTYDSRIEKRNEELNRQENISQDLKEKSKMLENEAMSWEAELASERQLMDDMDDDLAGLESDVGNLIAKSDKQKNEIKVVKRKIGDQRRKIKSQQAALKVFERAGGSAADPERYRVLQQERNLLANEYKKLLTYSLALSNAAK